MFCPPEQTCSIFRANPLLTLAVRFSEYRLEKGVGVGGVVIQLIPGLWEVIIPLIIFVANFVKFTTGVFCSVSGN